MNQNVNELRVANDVAKALSVHWACDVCYVTAELEPFSRQQKPDIVFRPLNPTSEVPILFFVDFKLTKGEPFHNRYIESAAYRKDYVSETTGGFEVIYILGTNAALPLTQHTMLTSHNIIPLEKIGSADDFAKRLMDLASAKLCSN